MFTNLLYAFLVFTTPFSNTEQLFSMGNSAQNMLDPAYGDGTANPMFLKTHASFQSVSNTAEPDTTQSSKSLRAFKDCNLCPEMIVMKAGSYEIGSSEGDADELPTSKITLSHDFAIGRFEITFDEWEQCAASQKCKPQLDDSGWGRGKRPIIFVSWQDAIDYVDWLSEKTGHSYRLPTEAEWEYAARAGTDSHWSYGNSEGEICDFGNTATEQCVDGYPDQTAPVGSYKPNAIGLYDMHGNVWEWTADCYHDNYVGIPVDGSPWIDDCGDEYRIVGRGGSWHDNPSFARSTNRVRLKPDIYYFNMGFRVVRDF